MKLTRPFAAHLLLFLLLCLVFQNAANSQSLRFTDTSYVNLGNATALRLTNFTLEAWIKIEGYGSTTETGSTGTGGGQTGVVPIVTRGRAESESASVDINYFLGYRLSDMKLIADFEDTRNSRNHSVASSAALPMNQWVHVGASFNVSTQQWKLFIGTTVQTISISGGPFTPRSASLVNACIGSTLNTGTGIRAGFFNGRIDEVRIWNRALTSLSTAEVTSGTGLVGRWGMNEGSGSSIANSIAGGSTGAFSTINPLWVTGFNQVDTTTNAAVDFNGVHDYISFGSASTLNTSAPSSTGFTLEAWIKIEGNGVATSTGSGGIAAAVPIIAKGRSESDASGVNMNYFLGITPEDVLVADFEEASGSNTGLNHPITGSGASATITRNVWTHVAVTYNIADGIWSLYKNGVKVSTLDMTNGLVPENISTQHASIASALSTTGAPSGYFNGKIDEVRIWKRALSDAEILANKNLQLTSGTGLLGRWSLNENGGVTATNSVAGAANGTLRSNNISTHPANGGPSWSAQGFAGNNDSNVPPNQPTSPAPANNTVASSLNPQLCAVASDPNGGSVRVRFFGRKKPASGKFTIIGLPDTQYYTAEPQGTSGGNNAMFKAQTKWIADNRQAMNIVYVATLGDCVNNGDDPPGSDNTIEWRRADTAYKTIENPALTGLPEGIPYGVTVGNHDQSPNGSASGTTTYFNQYFGEARFSGRSYYGGHYSTNNDNFYDLFSAGGVDFLVISMEYNTSPSADLLNWAANLVQTNSTRRVIVMVHYAIDESTAFGAQGLAIYNKLKVYPNFVLFISGHIHQTDGEARRSDVFNGNTVHTLLSDYQGRTGGGNGLLRIYEFDPSLNKLSVKTYSPYTGNFETDADSQFELDINLGTPTGANNFTQIGEVNVASGSNACINWPNLTAASAYEWYAEVYDGQVTTTGPIWTFNTPAAQAITNINQSSLMERDGFSQQNTGTAIYPNPSSRAGFNIIFSRPASGNIKVSVYDVSGKLHLDKQVAASNNVAIREPLSPGIYFVKIVRGAIIENKKLVVE